MRYLFLSLCFLALSFEQLVAQDLTSEAAVNRSSMPKNKQDLGQYLMMMDDPYSEDKSIYDEIFDNKITDKMRERMFRPVRSSDEIRLEQGKDFKTLKDRQEYESENDKFSKWVSKKFAQHHIEKSMEQAPKGSALGIAHNARIIVKDYKVEMTPGNEFSMGYDLPTNKAKLGVKSKVGDHFVHAGFNEDDLGPGDLKELYYYGNKKIHSTNFISKYSFVNHYQTFRVEQDLFYEGLIMAYQLEQDIKVSSHYMDHFVGLAFSMNF